MNELNKLYDSAYWEIQKKIVGGFQELSKATEKLGARTRQLGWKQRDVLIKHVYSDYKMHEELNTARREWEKVSWEYNVNHRLFQLMREYRDIYGYFPEYVELYHQINGIIELAGKEDEFEIARILVKWRDKMLYE